MRKIAKAVKAPGNPSFTGFLMMSLGRSRLMPAGVPGLDGLCRSLRAACRLPPLELVKRLQRIACVMSSGVQFCQVSV